VTQSYIKILIPDLPRKRNLYINAMKTFLIIIITAFSCLTIQAQIKKGDSPFYEAMRELPPQERE
jgi:hypothetical protein